eukprot:6181102-Pleurochrysis_carterae.AAC.4
MLDLDLSLHRPSHHHRTAWSCADSMVDVVDQATSACDADDFREEAHQRRVSPECSLHAPAEDAAIAASLVSTAAFEPNATHVTGSRRVQPQDIQSSYSHSIAGAAAGFVATVALHPLDLVKTRLHVQESNGKRLPYYRNLLHAFRSIVEVEGFLGLYQGVLPNIVGGTTAWALYMYMYNASKTWLAQNHPGLSSSAVYLTAATAAGAASTVVVHPIFIIKTRLQLQLSIKEQSVPLSSTLIPVEKRNNYTGTLAAVRLGSKHGHASAPETRSHQNAALSKANSSFSSAPILAGGGHHCTLPRFRTVAASSFAWVHPGEQLGTRRPLRRSRSSSDRSPQAVLQINLIWKPFPAADAPMVSSVKITCRLRTGAKRCALRASTLCAHLASGYLHTPFR